MPPMMSTSSIQYPPQHRQIVKELISGKFIVDDSPFFLIVHSHRAFYESFFEETYGYFLEGAGEYFYLSSAETTENGSRDLLLFLSVLCYEYHNRGKDVVHKVNEGSFLVDEIARYLDNSSKRDLIKATQAADLKAFLDHWNKRNVLEYVRPDHREFRFKKPIALFLRTAFALYEDHLQSR